MSAGLKGKSKAESGFLTGRQTCPVISAKIKYKNN
jgi:hypothetical protein